MYKVQQLSQVWKYEGDCMPSVSSWSCTQHYKNISLLALNLFLLFIVMWHFFSTFKNKSLPKYC